MGEGTNFMLRKCWCCCEEEGSKQNEGVRIREENEKQDEGIAQAQTDRSACSASAGMWMPTCITRIRNMLRKSFDLAAILCLEQLSMNMVYQAL